MPSTAPRRPVLSDPSVLATMLPSALSLSPARLRAAAHSVHIGNDALHLKPSYSLVPSAQPIDAACVPPSSASDVHRRNPHVQLRVQARRRLRQCEKRSGTNVKCTPLTEVAQPGILHYCKSHLVPPDSAAVMYRSPRPATE
ncbi:hypothetical protein F503_02435 [Ophiostoma piceae UAMH 11346]|uniref:Uncharacterized protein n=1 Tax=Ophiostoma piceae (strain UAMH 11346) TaxID=1262450 RepID=S3C0N5_OPHP1|nr:hypothetical protein F503_02435 [Ophiostoma piceae UAMH 11346]